jgi:hypothetical protein
MPCPQDVPALSFETLLADPMVRLAMASDHVSEEELRALLEAVGRARAEHDERAVGG